MFIYIYIYTYRYVPLYVHPWKGSSTLRGRFQFCTNAGVVEKSEMIPFFRGNVDNRKSAFVKTMLYGQFHRILRFCIATKWVEYIFKKYLRTAGVFSTPF